MRNKEPIIAIDGPAGSGKGAVSAMLARRFGFTLIETGAIYRSLALRAIERRVDLNNETALVTIAEDLDVDFRFDGDINHVLLDGEDVSPQVREPAVAAGASRVAKLPKVRTALLDLQRRLGARGGAIAEGRDIGTVVFPDAELKLFLTASEEERARRRWLQLKETGHEQPFEEVLAEQRERDARDTGRATAPLKQAEDAVLIDSTALNLQQVVDAMADHVDRVRS